MKKNYLTNRSRVNDPPILAQIGYLWQNDFLSLKYPLEVRVQHKRCSTICGTPVPAILNHKNSTGSAGGARETLSSFGETPHPSSSMRLNNLRMIPNWLNLLATQSMYWYLIATLTINGAWNPLIDFFGRLSHFLVMEPIDWAFFAVPAIYSYWSWNPLIELFGQPRHLMVVEPFD